MTLGPAKGRSENVVFDPCGGVLAGALQEGMMQIGNLQSDRFMAREEVSGY